MTILVIDLALHAFMLLILVANGVVTFLCWRQYRVWLRINNTLTYVLSGIVIYPTTRREILKMHAPHMDSLLRSYLEGKGPV